MTDKKLMLWLNLRLNTVISIIKKRYEIDLNNTFLKNIGELGTT